MQANIVEEVYKLRSQLLAAVNNNPLPLTIKLMIANEMIAALSEAEANEVRSIAALKAESAEEKTKVGESKDGKYANRL